MDKLSRQEKELDKFLDENKANDDASESIYQLAKAAFKEGWKKGEEDAKRREKPG